MANWEGGSDRVRPPSTGGEFVRSEGKAKAKIMDLRSTEMGIVPIGEVTMTWLKPAGLREKEKRRRQKRERRELRRIERENWSSELNRGERRKRV